MAVTMNPLETEEDIQEYKKLLSTKSLYYLKCVLGNFRRDEKREKQRYVNLPLRIELITKEIELKSKLH